MMTLPTPLSNFMKGQKLDGLKPFALLYRNKWDSVNNKFELEQTPIDISELIAKPNTLSMTLDVNEVAQYNANNVTLTLSDTKNYFVEGTPNSYFPEGYHIYGSRIVLYYGTDGVNRTPLFTGVIKEFPTHKPENYQVDVKLVSPLEMLKDIEAKDFSDKVTGEALTYIEDDSEGHKVYHATGTGVGGFDAVYANGTKLFEGVDYETDQLNALGLPAVVTIINSNYYSSTITADYYTWKTDLTVEQIIAGVAALGGYVAENAKIQPVSWNTAVRNPPIITPVFATLGYTEGGNNTYLFNWSRKTESVWNETYYGNEQHGGHYNILPNNWDYSFNWYVDWNNGINSVALGDSYNGATAGLHYLLVNNGILIDVFSGFPGAYTWTLYVCLVQNGQLFDLASTSVSGRGRNLGNFRISRRGSTINVYDNENLIATCNYSGSMNLKYQRTGRVRSQTWNFYDDDMTPHGANLTLPCIISSRLELPNLAEMWGAIQATLEGSGQISYNLQTYFRNTTNINWQGPNDSALDIQLARSERYLYYILGVNNNSEQFNIKQPSIYYLASTLFLRLVKLGGKTVLEILEDFALISGYEFGVDRQGVFFFRPRVASTTPTYILDHDEIVKVDTVKKNLSDFFTKLTLTFAQVPLEFYANTGERPTPIDKYGVINKEIDKPDIVNYDNPELAQAIGPQLLEVYSALPNVIQATGKLNLALELGDIVSLRRNMNLITPEQYTDYSKYEDLNTYYRACKITGMNYNFSKKQITYTLRDVSNKNTEPMYELEQFVYELPIKLGVKK